MLKRRKQKKRNRHAVDTLITTETRITGDVQFSGSMYVDGHVVGNVSAADEHAVLTIGAHGRVDGEITVPHVIVYGSVTGDINAVEEVELMEEARVDGNVYYNLLQMAMGAAVNGKLVHRDPANTQRLEHHKKDDTTPPDEG
jgi:cytoskeletal protein CcmA (bactofilin family)